MFLPDQGKAPEAEKGPKMEYSRHNEISKLSVLYVNSKIVPSKVRQGGVKDTVGLFGFSYGFTAHPSIDQVNQRQRT